MTSLACPDCDYIDDVLPENRVSGWECAACSAMYSGDCLSCQEGTVETIVKGTALCRRCHEETPSHPTHKYPEPGRVVGFTDAPGSRLACLDCEGSFWPDEENKYHELCELQSSRVLTRRRKQCDTRGCKRASAWDLAVGQADQFCVRCITGQAKKGRWRLKRKADRSIVRIDDSPVPAHERKRTRFE